MDDILRALDSKLWYLALAVALSIPDICSSAEVKRLPGEKIWKGTEDRYTRWCAKYLTPRYGYLKPVDCWALRGGLLHNGKLHGHSKLKYQRLLFTLPNRNNNRWDEHVFMSEGNLQLLQLDLVWFCEKMVAAAIMFMDEKGRDDIVSENLDNLVRYRREGVPPFHTPVIY